MRINWNHIDNEKTFQRLINHLVGLECPVLGFTPSSPFIGKDGGWDGRFDGLYPRENLEGIFSFQSKWTKYNRKDALDNLKSPIGKEIKKALEKGVDHLRIATNAELDVDQVLELEALKPNGLKSLKIWERDHLTQRIEMRPILQYLFFKFPQHPLFVPWQQYFLEYEPQLISVISADLSTTKDVTRVAAEFLRNDKSQILLLSAPAGNGKSHFLREIAEISPGINPKREVYVARTGILPMKEAMQSEILSGTNYLLLIDDAERECEDISTILALLPSSSGTVKVILACRSASVQLVLDTISDSRFKRQVTQIEIPEWDKPDLIKLLRLSADKKTVEREEEIVTTYRNPYLITWIGQNLRGKAVPVNQLLEKLLTDLENDVRDVLRNLIDDQFLVKKLLLHLSLTVPFQLSSDSTKIRVIAKELEVTTDRVFEAIQRLLKSGILRQVGYQCRFSPDLKGEFFLNQKLKPLDSTGLKDLVLKWIDVCPEKLFINLGSTYRIGEVSVIKDVLTEMVQSWAKDATSTSASQRSEFLDWAEKIAFFVSAPVIALINIYLEVAAPEPVEKPTFISKYKFRLTTDHFGPVIMQLLRVPRVRSEILKLILKIDTANIEGTYGNYRPKALIQASVCPLENSVVSIEQAIDFLSSTGGPLLFEALKEVLGGAHEFTRSTGKSITIGERSLANSPEVIQIRETAFLILLREIKSSTIMTFDMALELASDVGETRMGQAKMESLPLKGRFNEEYRRIIECLVHILQSPKDVAQAASILNFLEKHWALKKPSEELAETTLAKYLKTPQLLFLQYYLFEEVIENFEKFRQDSNNDPEGRWSHYVRNRSVFWDKPFDSFSKIVPALAKEYQSPEQIIAFLNEMERFLEGIDTTWRPKVVISWAKSYPDVFSVIRNDSNIWPKVPEKFQIEISQALIESEVGLKALLEEAHSEIATLSGIKCAQFLDTVMDRLPVDEVEKELAFFIENRGQEFYYAVLIGLGRMHKRLADRQLVIKLSIQILKKIPTNDRTLDGLAFVLHVLQEERSMSLDEIVALREYIVPGLVRVNSLNYHGDELISILFQDTEEVMNFLALRLQEMQQRYEKRDTDYDCFPHEGLQSLRKFLTGDVNFGIFIERFLVWKEQFKYGLNEVMQLMKPVRNMRDADGRVYLENSIKSYLQKGEVERALTLAKSLAFDDTTIELVILLCDSLVDNSFEDKAKRFLTRLTVPEEWSNEIGKPPPVLVELKQKFIKVSEGSSKSVIREFALECASDVQKRIEDGLKVDKDRFGD